MHFQRSLKRRPSVDSSRIQVGLPGQHSLQVVATSRLYQRGGEPYTTNISFQEADPVCRDAHFSLMADLLPTSRERLSDSPDGLVMVRPLMISSTFSRFSGWRRPRNPNNATSKGSNVGQSESAVRPGHVGQVLPPIRVSGGRSARKDGPNPWRPRQNGIL